MLGVTLNQGDYTGFLFFSTEIFSLQCVSTHAAPYSLKKQLEQETELWESALANSTAAARSYLMIPRIFFNRSANLETCKTLG